MNRCLQEDRLVDIGHALDWEVEAGLRHLQNCASCAAMLADLQELRDVLAQQERVTPELLTQMMNAIETEAAREESIVRVRLPVSIEGGIRFVASTVIVFVIVSVTVALQIPDAVALWPALLMAIAVGTAAAVAGDRPRRTGETAAA